MTQDLKPPKRIRNPGLLADLHLRWRFCALCGDTGRLSLHHILKHPRHDLEGNLVMLCGDGVRGCHGQIEAGDADTKRKLGLHLERERPDSIAHIMWQLKTPEAAKEWFRQMTGD